MYDLIYLNDYDQYQEAKADLAMRFPGSKIGDASDDIHFYRLDIQNERLSVKQYLSGMLDLGMARCSLHFEMMRQMETRLLHDWIDQWLTE
jgi:hypothetical protein